METRILIRSNPKPNAVNPLPQRCSWWNLIMIGRLVSEIFMFESVDRRTDGRTDAGSSPILLAHPEPSALVSKKWSQGFPHYNPMGDICCHGNQSSDPIRPKNLMQPIPRPNDAPDEIWLRSASWSQRYSCLKVWTHGRTPARVPYYKLTLSLRLWWAKNEGARVVTTLFVNF